MKQPERNTDLSVRASTLLLLLALGGLLLRLTGAAHWLEQVAPVAATLLALLAPAWALCGSVFASAYLVLSMWRPYNAVQHLLEMGLGVLLTVLMLPAF